MSISNWQVSFKFSKLRLYMLLNSCCLITKYTLFFIILPYPEFFIGNSQHHIRYKCCKKNPSKHITRKMYIQIQPRKCYKRRQNNCGISKSVSGKQKNKRCNKRRKRMPRRERIVWRHIYQYRNRGINPTRARPCCKRLYYDIAYYESC